MIDEAAMSPQPFGTLNRLSIQEVWKTERGSFTPWLAENLDYRAERIGLDLELVATEVPVGPFRVDLVAQVTDIYDLAVVENQFGPTDTNKGPTDTRYLTTGSPEPPLAPCRSRWIARSGSMKAPGVHARTREVTSLGNVTTVSRLRT